MSAIESTKPGTFISLAAAAEMLGISVHTLRRRIAAIDLVKQRDKAIKTDGRAIKRGKVKTTHDVLQVSDSL